MHSADTSMRNLAGRRHAGICPRRWPGTRRRAIRVLSRRADRLEGARCTARGGLARGARNDRCHAAAALDAARLDLLASAGTRCLGQGRGGAVAISRHCRADALLRQPGRRGTGPYDRCAAARGCPHPRGNRRGHRGAGDRTCAGTASDRSAHPGHTRVELGAARPKRPLPAGRGRVCAAQPDVRPRHQCRRKYSGRARFRAALPGTVPRRSRAAGARPAISIRHGSMG